MSGPGRGSWRRHLTLRLVGGVMLLVSVLWIAYLVSLYRGASWQSDMLPAPARLAAVAALLETTPAAHRPPLLAALNSDRFEVSLRPGDAVAGAFRDLPVHSRYTVAEYDAALGGRRFSIAVRPPDRPRPAFLARRLVPLTLEFRVALATGGTMVAVARAPFLTTAAGLPVGLLAGLVGSLIGLVTLALVFAASRPLGALAEAVATLDPDSPPRPLPQSVAFPPELRRLTEAYNTLHGQVSMLLRNRMELIGGISHDVRTFATRLRLKVDAIADATMRDSAVRDIEDMTRLLDDAVMTSRAGAGELQTELVGLAELFAEDCAELARAGRPVRFSPPPGADPLVVLGDRVALRRICANLVENAIKYGKAAHVRLEAEDDLAVLVVEDEGPGIPAAEREALFQPFHRREASRNRATGGAGLGLAVVRMLAEAQGGSVSLGPAATGGLAARVAFPRFPS